MTNAVTLAPHQLRLIRQTIAADCNPDNFSDPALKRRAEEDFNLFMEAARSYGLDPFRRQIAPLVFSKNDPKKRQMAIVPSRDGLRVIAQRCGDYRPASEPAEIAYDETLKGPTNPKGIVSATIRLWKQDKKGDWYPVVGVAHWDEFVPLTMPDSAFEWVDTGEVWPDTGKPKKKKVRKEGAEAEPILDPTSNWARMPVVMITKCAESQALRAGWPDQFGGLYAEEEMEQAVAADASEIVREEEERRRLERAGAFDSITLFFEKKLENVPVGKVHDRCIEFIEKNDAETVRRWTETNEASLRHFWAMAPNDALDVKKAVEAKTKEAA